MPAPPQPACTLRQSAAELVLPPAPLDVVPVTLDAASVSFILYTGADASILSFEAGHALGFKRTTD